MLAIMSVLCACCQPNPQTVIKLQPQTCGHEDTAVVYISTEPGCTMQVVGDKLVMSRHGVGGGPVIWLAGDDNPEEVEAYYARVADDLAARHTGEPKAWLGVTTSPVPEALKAHIGRGGLMIGNIVVGSPADDAGLERYDVVVSFDGKVLKEFDDLLEALAEVSPGEKVEMVVIRAGKDKTLKVTPGERHEAEAFEYKYEQEEEEVLDDLLRFRGHRLRQGPQGQWIFEPLGRLKDLPEPLRHFEGDWEGLWKKEWGDAWKTWPGVWKSFEHVPFDFDLHVDTDKEGRVSISVEREGDEEGEFELTFDIERDGKMLMVHRAKDGTITVKRADKDGETSTDTYDSLEEFKQGDPEAYKEYKNITGGERGYSLRLQYPPGKHLPGLQQRYQKQIELHLEKAVEKAREAQRDAERAAEKALREYGEAREKAQKKLREGREDAERRVEKALRVYREGREKAAEADLDITVHDDGSISVSVQKGDTRVIYEFKSKEDFKRREPELFEKFRDALE